MSAMTRHSRARTLTGFAAAVAVAVVALIVYGLFVLAIG